MNTFIDHSIKMHAFSSFYIRRFDDNCFNFMTMFLLFVHLSFSSIDDDVIVLTSKIFRGHTVKSQLGAF